MMMSKYEIAKIRQLIKQTYEAYSDGEHVEEVDRADSAELMMLTHHALNISNSIDVFIDTYHSVAWKSIKRRAKKNDRS